MGHDAQVMRADQVADLYVRLADQGVDCCVVGGWGVDALVGTVAREHKDLDVLMPLTALRDGLSFWAEEGFELAYTWVGESWGCRAPPVVGRADPVGFCPHPPGRS
jgi:lincosamide nucleotidyltransferase A/C/D/E